MKDNYLETVESEKRRKLISTWFIAIGLLLMFILDFEGMVALLKRIALGMVALFTSIRGLIASIPLGIWLVLLLFNRD